MKPAVVISISKVNYSVMSNRQRWNYCGNLLIHKKLPFNQSPLNIVGTRNYGMLVARVLRGALKLRYLLLGGAVGGTVTLNKVRTKIT